MHGILGGRLKYYHIPRFLLLPIPGFTFASDSHSEWKWTTVYTLFYQKTNGSTVIRTHILSFLFVHKNRNVPDKKKTPSRCLQIELFFISNLRHIRTWHNELHDFLCPKRERTYFIAPKIVFLKMPVYLLNFFNIVNFVLSSRFIRMSEVVQLLCPRLSTKCDIFPSSRSIAISSDSVESRAKYIKTSF